MSNAEPHLTSTSPPPSPQEEETRPPHTAEIGTLKKLSVSGGTAWLGSSSGVYFVNTVRRAFASAFSNHSNSLSGNTSLGSVGAGDSDSSDGEALPASEDIITGEDDTRDGHAGYGYGNERNSWWDGGQDFHRRIVDAVGRPPADQKVAMELVTTFFRQTHPLFPFLHGPKFLEDMKEIYVALSQSPQAQSQSHSKSGQNTPVQKMPASNRRVNSNTSVTSNSNSNSNNYPLNGNNLGSLQSADPLKLITFQVIINIAGLSHASDTSKAALPISSTIPSAQSLLTLILPLSTTPLLPTIQLLLAAELYLLSTISLRHSSTLAGVVLRLIYHTGLHRCPLRYASLTASDCEIRKRVFWSAYALDRHLSLALGDPNTFQDSDIDVCLSRNGEEGELHRAVARELLSESEREVEMRLHFPRDREGRIVPGDRASGEVRIPRHRRSVNMADAPSDAERKRMMEDDPQAGSSGRASSRGKQLREAALTAYVDYGKLTGRIIEIFHKSINFRFPKEDAIGFLTADIENWWNDLPSTLTGEFNPVTSGEDPDDVDPGLIQQHKLLTPFFTLLYHQLLLLLNRPRLSLDQSTAEFQQGLQVCIRSSRNTLSALKKHRENRQSMFLPGLLSAAWMSGLIIAFACQLGKYPKTRACSDIKSCLVLLESMNIKWYTVKNCHKVLSLLLANITSRKTILNGYLPAGRNDPVSYSASTSQTAGITRKRTRESISVDNSEAEPSPKRDSLAGISPASSDFRPPVFRSPEVRSNIATGYQNISSVNNNNNIPTGMSSLRQDSAANMPGIDYMPSQNTNQMLRGAMYNDFESTNNNTGTEAGNQWWHGAAIYADPQDIAFAQSNHSMGLPELQSSIDDQMFWSNIDSNLFDVFGAISWETMTGPVGFAPNVTNLNAWDMSTFGNAGNGSGNGGNPGNGGFL